MSVETDRKHAEYAKHIGAVADCCEKAAEFISSGFIWHKTVEGHDYWSEIDKQLKALAEAARQANGENNDEN